VVYGGGAIEAGDGLCIRSRRFQRVEIFVAPDARLTFGKKVFLNQGVRIVCGAGVSIGDGCQIGDETVILDNDFHGAGTADAKKARVQIEENVWLATRVIVLRGVTIGKGSVVGAGSVVTRSIPPFSFAAGAPARVIKSLGPE
jgi:maltose O-acetyltransferase